MYLSERQLDQEHFICIKLISFKYELKQLPLCWT